MLRNEAAASASAPEAVKITGGPPHRQKRSARAADWGRAAAWGSHGVRYMFLTLFEIHGTLIASLKPLSRRGGKGGRDADASDLMPNGPRRTWGGIVVRLCRGIGSLAEGQDFFALDCS